MGTGTIMGFNYDTWGGSWKRSGVSAWGDSWGIITIIIAAVKKHRGFLRNVGRMMK